MNNAELEFKILKFLKRNVTPDRLKHILGVARLAERWARKHGLDPKRARLAGLLHDTARDWSGAKLKRYARERRLKVPAGDFLAKRHPVLLHAYVGADLARREFGVKDREILSAVAKHTLGDERMTRFDKLVFLADLLAPDRTYAGVDALRRLAARDLDRAFMEGFAGKMSVSLIKRRPLHPEAARVWNSILFKGARV